MSAEINRGDYFLELNRKARNVGWLLRARMALVAVQFDLEGGEVFGGGDQEDRLSVDDG